MKTILIVGAGFLQAFVIKKAKELGYGIIAIDKNPDALGFKFADEYEVVDIVDQEACLRFARSKKINGVITVATDYGVLSAAYVAQQMDLPGLDYDVAKVIKNKYQVRHILTGNMADGMLQHYLISDVDELNQIKDKVEYPVMVKPCDGSGSKAAARVDNFYELKNACVNAIKTSLIGRALIEDFVHGKEYGVESLVYNGEVHVLAVMGKHMTSPPDYAELGHYYPGRLKIEDKLKDVVRKSIKELGINYGAVNMDVLITDNGGIYIVDIGARMGGNLIGSHIIPIGTGIDYMGYLIRSAVGDTVEVDTEQRILGVNVATRLLALKPGVVKGLPDFEKIKHHCKVDVFHHIKVNDRIRKYHNNLDGCGYVVAQADNLVEAVRRAEEAKQLIDNGIVREETS